MQYVEAAHYVYRLAPMGIRLGLDRMRRAFELRGRPDRKLTIVQVAGTNGKGSTCAFVESMLRAQGVRTGMYTSPHLHRYTERFRIAGRPVSQARLARRITALRPWLEGPDAPALTFFEVSTLLAAETFVDAGCEVAIFEVGLGGRLDSTTALDPVVTAITRVAMDHRDRLGDTLEAIAREKAGVFRSDAAAVLAVRDAGPRRVAVRRARRVGATLDRIGQEFDVTARPDGLFDVRTADRALCGLRSGLGGRHQADNLACAVRIVDRLAAHGFEVSDAAVRKGVQRARWAGRLELIKGPPDALVDAAHNPDAARVLAEHMASLRERYPKIVLLFGALTDKDIPAMMGCLAPHCDRRVFSMPDSKRAASPSQLASEYGGRAVRDPIAALRAAQRSAGPDGLVVVAGSIYFMARVRAELVGVEPEPTITL